MIAIINGPNLNMLGRRDPEVYGTCTFEDYLPALQHAACGHSIEYFQSNSEGEIIDAIQKFGFDPECLGIVINAGAYAHYSLAIRDAIADAPVPCIEVHISNIFAREEFRRRSVISDACRGCIVGLGMEGYILAVQSIRDTEIEF